MPGLERMRSWREKVRVARQFEYVGDLALGLIRSLHDSVVTVIELMFSLQEVLFV